MLVGRAARDEMRQGHHAGTERQRLTYWPEPRLRIMTHLVDVSLSAFGNLLLGSPL